jgi:hypothetical protein
MSCALTVDAVLNRAKTVTRRRADTWTTLKPGDYLTLIEKGTGLPKGATQRILADVEVVSNRLEPLALSIMPGELSKEGLDHLTHPEFVDLWVRSHGYRTTDGLERLTIVCRRIEWQYLDDPEHEGQR